MWFNEYNVIINPKKFIVPFIIFVKLEIFYERNLHSEVKRFQSFLSQKS